MEKIQKSDKLVNEETNFINIIFSYEKVLQFIGIMLVFWVAIKFVYKILKTLYIYYSAPIDFKKYGKWGIVTGCTDGIGKAFAEKLAQKGLNLVLISRSFEKLNLLSEALKMQHKIKTLIIEADFSSMI